MSRLLVIDDEVTFCTAVVFQLQDLGHTVEVASDVESGIACFTQAMKAQQPVDIVITDMLMPRAEGSPAADEAGLLVVEQIQQLSKETLILVMTAYGSIENAVKAVRLAAYGYLTKPFSSEELQLTLSRVLEHQAAIREKHALERKLQEYERNKGHLSKLMSLNSDLFTAEAPSTRRRRRDKVLRDLETEGRLCGWLSDSNSSKKTESSSPRHLCVLCVSAVI